MKQSRKEFLLSSAGMIALCSGLKNRKAGKFFTADTLSGTRMSMLYDSSKCIGCKMCENACAWENDLIETAVAGESPSKNYLEVKSLKNDDGRKLFFKRHCLHCKEASCEAVCPTGAAHHEGEYVMFDEDVCIGCGYCVEACPYGIPVREEEKAAQKCIFCLNTRIKKGKEPACVNACPVNAGVYGEREDLLAAADTRVDKLKNSGYPDAQLYGEDKLGGLNVLYILQKPPSFYGLPENPKEATKSLIAQWASGSLTAAALIVPFWYFYKRRSRGKEELAKEKENGK